MRRSSARSGVDSLPGHVGAGEAVRCVRRIPKRCGLPWQQTMSSQRRCLRTRKARSAFARLAEARSDESLFQRLRDELDAHWPAWDIVQVEERLVRRASEFCRRSRLRGYDSVHLAATERIHGVSSGQADFRFGVFDANLARAARNLDIPLLLDA